MKILVIGHTYITNIYREKWRSLARQNRQCEIKVVFPYSWNDALSVLHSGDVEGSNEINCKFIPMKCFRSGDEVTYGYWPRKLGALFKNFKPDIVHVEQGDNAFSYLQAILFTKLFCSHARLTFFTWINWSIRRGWKYRLLWRPIERCNLRASSGAIVGNADARTILQEKGFKKLVCVIPQLGVDLSYFNPAEEGQEKKRILFVGRLVVEKGVFLLAQAFAQLAPIFPDWTLHFVGAGPCAYELEQYARQGSLCGRITFHSVVAHDMVREHMQKSAILVLPSYDTPDWREQFGRVLIEAMACKIAVIGSSAGEIKNVVRDAGLVFEQKNLQDLARCLRLLMQDEEERKLIAQRGYDKVMRLYTHEAIAAATYAFWKELLRGKNSD